MTRRWSLSSLLLLISSGIAHAQTTSDACSYAAANQYPVNTSCVFLAFNKPSGYVANYNPGTCNAGNNDDAYGWFQATGNVTTVTFDPASLFQDPILHILTGPCGGPYTEVACADVGLGGGNESVTIPTVPGNNYLIRVQTWSSNSAMNGSLCVWTPPPPPPACGTVAYDPGGAAANYANNTNFTATYCPAIAGDAVTLNFTAFNTENGFDYVTLYDGSTIFAPVIGTWSGTNSPGIVTTTNPGGCITLQFISDNIVTAPGWTVSITCTTIPPPVQACGTTIYDSGGAAGNYANNQNTVVTYCPTNAGDVVSLNFSSFSVTAPDVLTIYNGPSTASPVLGSYVGTGLPATAVSSDPGGCLTVQFISDAATVSTGWAAAVNCGPPPPPPSGDCIYVLTMNDAGGNGWGASSVGLSINGSPFTYYTVTGTTNQYVFGVNIGDVVVLNYNNAGPNQGQNTFSLAIQGQTTICSGGPSPPAGIQCQHTVTCDPPPNPPQDCTGAVTVCNGQSFSNNSNNTGNTLDLNATNQGCLASGERQGTWYIFSPSSPGTVGFTITPAVPTDYDFAVWGPYPPGSTTATVCPPAGPPLRCSYAAPFGDTGCGGGASDLSEGANGNRWVSTFNVAVGQVYLLYVDNFSSNGQAFSLGWQLSNGASLDCTVLPIELLAFDAEAKGDEVLLNWITGSEHNSDRFEVERSRNAQDFELIGTLPTAGTSDHQRHYSFLDREPHAGINHYRLRHVDVDGGDQLSPVETVFFREGQQEVLAVPNPGSSTVEILVPPGSPGALLVMVDPTGRELARIPLAGTRLSFNAEALPRGLYGLRVVDTAGNTRAFGSWIKE